MKSNSIMYSEAELKKRVELGRFRKTQKEITEKSLQLELPMEILLTVSSNKSSRYPTLLTRIPIFEPISFRTKSDTAFTKGQTYKTNWGSIERIGPGLNMYDEDTLIGILQIGQQKKLIGNTNSFPVPLKLVRDKDKTIVHVGNVSAYAINKFLGRGVSGNDLRSCRESIKRLSVTNFIFYNDILGKEGKTPLFDYIGDQDAYGEITIQFRPVIITLLANYTYINLDVRRSLSDVGKSVHKFLSGQRPNYEITLEKLMGPVGFQRSVGAFKQALMGKAGKKPRVGELEKMKNAGWLVSYHITGTGRTSPFKLIIER